MTDIGWGAEIAVDGKRLDWLTDAETSSIKWSVHTSPHDFGVSQPDVWKRFGNHDWEALHAIRLPASHPYYLATSRGFTYWPGGENAPEDWDGGEVLIGDGRIEHPGNSSWAAHCPNWCCLIGYRKRAEQPAPAIAPELVERMATAIQRHVRGFVNIRQGYTVEAEFRAIAAELSPPDPDLTLAKSIVGDAEAIALAIKAARENANN